MHSLLQNSSSLLAGRPDHDPPRLIPVTKAMFLPKISSSLPGQLKGCLCCQQARWAFPWTFCARLSGCNPDPSTRLQRRATGIDTFALNCASVCPRIETQTANRSSQVPSYSLSALAPWHAMMALPSVPIREYLTQSSMHTVVASSFNTGQVLAQSGCARHWPALYGSAMWLSDAFLAFLRKPQDYSSGCM